MEVRYNTINTGIFKPTSGDFRERHGLQDKKLILGVASTWEKRKGLDDFAKLAEIYTTADVLFNPTYEDNYPTVNLEAQACGTRVITYNTGGSPETSDETGIVTEKGNLETLIHYVMGV